MNKLAFAWFSLGLCGAAAAADPYVVTLTPPDLLGPLLNARGQRYLTGAEFEQKVGRASGMLAFGVLREAGGGAGMQSMSMLLNARPAMRFTSVSLGYALSPQGALMVMASQGKAESPGSPDGLLARAVPSRVTAYSIGYTQRQVFTGNDRLSVTLSLPARVSDPAMQRLAGVAERDVELAYTRFVGRDGGKARLTGALMWRVNPGHDANARPDLLLGVRYSYGF
ncbi:hypothetical protein KW842_10055 [Duganella sp. sic0402]|uniref:hypothetical protein n=1 Tax=Duganella sp. sic0402 TaxID=2854786 RepID=UPI001C482314|nr:hypothetical protein [Duganella sp. sic0402]MBV7536107.1 hypothetical protein [Duganella sp. sic0402]